jgi:hypothetical protein
MAEKAIVCCLHSPATPVTACVAFFMGEARGVRDSGGHHFTRDQTTLPAFVGSTSR